MGQGDEDGLTCTKHPQNFHRDVEQAAFSPSSMVPGIEDSPDPLLQFRIFFYRDAQYHHVDANLRQAPVYCPFMAKSHASLNFDGAMRTDANHAGNKPYARQTCWQLHILLENTEAKF
jgi:catalase